MPESGMRDQAALLGARVTESSSAVLGAAFELMGRRTRAIAEFWESAATTWEPEVRLGLQVDYFRRMADDYAEAVSEALAPWAEGPRVFEPAAAAPAEAFVPAPAAMVEPRVAPEPAIFAEPEAPRAPRPAKRPDSSAAADEGHLRGHDGEELDVRA